MARIRTIKPSFMESADVAALSRDARLFFLQLITQVDDAGRYVWSAKRVAGALYPFDDDVTPQDVEGWLSECEARGMVQRYGENYIQLTNFSKHQRINRPTPSIIPEPPKIEDSLSTHGALTEQVHREVEVEREVDKEDICRAEPPDVEEVQKFYNRKLERNFQPGSREWEALRARLREGASVETCKLVIEHKQAGWGDNPEMSGHLVPSTLFRPKHWDRYVSDAEAWEKAGRPDQNRNGKAPASEREYIQGVPNL